MALVRAMSSGVSGLQAQQMRLDTIGDNLANATTPGFKSGRVEFQTLLSQTLRFGSAPQGNLGGVNPIQVGLGTQVASTSRNFGQGQLETTGINSDLAIEGAGFFILKGLDGEQFYTRDGSFSINPTNLLHDPASGLIVQGVNADLATFTLPLGAALENVTIPVGDLQIAGATRNVVFDGNLNSSGDLALSGTTLQSAPLVDNAAANAPATSATLLSNLSRTSGATFIDLLVDGGDVLTVNAVKGGRTLPERRFFVGTTLPAGFDGFGTTLGDFSAFVERSLGINTGPLLQPGAIRDDDTNPNTTGISAAATVVTGTSVQVTGMDFVAAGAQAGVAGDILKFNNGPGAGQIARITAIGTTVTLNDTLTLTPLSATIPLPRPGDQFTIHEPAGVTVAGAATPWLTDGSMHIAGNVGRANAITSLGITNATDLLTFSPFSQIDAASGESIVSEATVFDSNGNPHVVEFTFALDSKGGVDPSTGQAGNGWRIFVESRESALLTPGGVAEGLERVVGSGQVFFSTDGQFLSEIGPAVGSFVSADLPNSGAASPLEFDPDFSGLTGFGGTQTAAFMLSQDGFPTGLLVDFSVNRDGVVTGIFSNGLSRTLAQIHTARFANPNGLESIGHSNFRAAANSGSPVVGVAGTQGRGGIFGGGLEASNVDFAEEFRDMIITQRAFQANARVITRADDLLQELMNIV